MAEAQERAIQLKKAELEAEGRAAVQRTIEAEAEKDAATQKTLAAQQAAAAAKEAAARLAEAARKAKEDAQAAELAAIAAGNNPSLPAPTCRATGTFPPDLCSEITSSDNLKLRRCLGLGSNDQFEIDVDAEPHHDPFDGIRPPLPHGDFRILVRSSSQKILSNVSLDDRTVHVAKVDLMARICPSTSP